MNQPFKNIKTFTLPLIFLLSLILTSTTHAAYYTEFDVTKNQVDFGNTEYKPYTGRITLGYDYNYAYAMEFHYNKGTSDDSIDQTTIDIDELMGLYFRVNFGVDRRSKIYVLFGATRTNLTITDSISQTEKEYDDYSYAIGVEDYFPGIKGLNLTLEYAELHKDSDLKIIGVSLGVKYNF